LQTFSELPLPAPLLEALSLLGFDQPLPVQAQSLPALLAGRDVLVQAETGSGKTVAFGLGILAQLEASLTVQGLVLCPTRELAEQVSGELRRLACRTPNVKILCLCGGVPFAPQRASLKQGAHVVVGTPLRLEEHLRKGSLSLESVRVLVLDEADRMLDMGFEPQIADVLRHAPSERQTLLFSATYPDGIASSSSRYQRDPLRIDVVGALNVSGEKGGAAAQQAAGDNVEQRFFRVGRAEPVALLARWLAHERPASALVFCSTRAECATVADTLSQLGWVAACIHGDMAQRERQHVMRLFANGSCTVLAATDVAARGWDIPDLPVVVNLGLSRDPTVHLHRRGRTGRLGRAGSMVSFVLESDGYALAHLERIERHAIVFQALPTAPAPGAPPRPRFRTLLLAAGKNKKLRPGDILGALTGEGGIAGADVGVIQIDESLSYVAVAAACAERALLRLEEAGVKGRAVKARWASLQLREDAS
jgi:ATP-independent RNA helicase DbpA